MLVMSGILDAFGLCGKLPDWPGKRQFRARDTGRANKGSRTGFVTRTRRRSGQPHMGCHLSRVSWPPAHPVHAITRGRQRPSPEGWLGQPRIPRVAPSHCRGRTQETPRKVCRNSQGRLAEPLPATHWTDSRYGKPPLPTGIPLLWIPARATTSNRETQDGCVLHEQKAGSTLYRLQRHTLMAFM